jgi:hypothetical protein
LICSFRDLQLSENEIINNMPGSKLQSGKVKQRQEEILDREQVILQAKQHDI